MKSKSTYYVFYIDENGCYNALYKMVCKNPSAVKRYKDTRLEWMGKGRGIGYTNDQLDIATMLGAQDIKTYFH